MTKSEQPIVLVTAGASGIGSAIARAFLDRGAGVHVCDIDQTALRSFADAHPQVHCHAADVSDERQVDTVFEALDGLDVLVNNAGIAGPTAAVEDISTDDWRRTMAVDVDGAFYCARRAVPLLRRAGGGSIVNIASTAGLFGYPYRLPYAMAKWAMIGMTKTLAMELGPSGIRVNAICPGSVSGPRIEGVMERHARKQGVSVDDIRRLYQRQSSLRCFVDAEDVAAMAVFLASPEGARISGQAIALDGHTESLSSLDE